MSPPTKALVIMAKAPHPGRVKLRLAPVFGAQAAADLARAFLFDRIEAAGAIADAVRIVSCEPDRTDPAFAELRHMGGLVLTSQRGADLGARMRGALQEALALGFQRVVLVGTDTPTLPVEILLQAFDRLTDVPVVIGPACDGGYYLIGCGREIPPVFESLPWGSDRVLEQTLARLNAERWPAALLPFWYDVDRPEDVLLLRRHLQSMQLGGGRSIAPRTAELLARIAPELRDAAWA